MNYQSDQIDKLAQSLCQAQLEMEVAKESSSNPHFRSKYADIAACWEAARIVNKHGIAVTQGYEVHNEKNYLYTMLMHSSGQWIKSVMIMPVVKPGSQEVGSCTTYCRRYSLMAALSLVSDDDDGEAAMKHVREEQKPKPKLMQKPSVDKDDPQDQMIKNPMQKPNLVILQKAMCALGNLIGEDDVEKFVSSLLEKYPELSKDEIIESALSNQKMIERFNASYLQWIKS